MKNTTAVFLLLLAAAFGCDALVEHSPEVVALRRIDKVWVTFDARDLLALPQPPAGDRGADWGQLLSVAQPTSIVREGQRYLVAFTKQQIDANAEMHTQVLMPTTTLVEKAVLSTEPVGVLVRQPHEDILLDAEAARVFLGLPAENASAN